MLEDLVIQILNSTEPFVSTKTQIFIPDRGISGCLVLQNGLPCDPLAIKLKGTFYTG
jgi:hypothetical protein